MVEENRRCEICGDVVGERVACAYCLRLICLRCVETSTKDGIDYCKDCTDYLDTRRPSYGI